MGLDSHPCSISLSGTMSLFNHKETLRTYVDFLRRIRDRYSHIICMERSDENLHSKEQFLFRVAAALFLHFDFRVRLLSRPASLQSWLPFSVSWCCLMFGRYRPVG